MTPDTIEAVARAICIAMDANLGVGHDEWDAISENEKRMFRQEARAAITAYQLAMAKDAVGKQYRFKMDGGSWTTWFGTQSFFPRATNVVIEERDVFAAPPAPAAPPWQPIETAPKDGFVMLYGEIASELSKGDGAKTWCIGEYNEGGVLSERPGFDWNVEPTCGYAVVCKPTHWMPLPKPPQEAILHPNSPVTA